MAGTLGSEFASCWQKIGRAVDHAESLKLKITAWYKRKPYGTVKKAEAGGSRHSVLVNISEPPPLDDLALIAGDCVSNLRSALDHLVYAAAIQDTGSDPPADWNKLQFPISDSFTQFTVEKARRLSSLSFKVTDAFQ